jgi:hypothetical protein
MKGGDGTDTRRAFNEFRYGTSMSTAAFFFLEDVSTGSNMSF